jgi:hypothetical protein
MHVVAAASEGGSRDEHGSACIRVAAAAAAAVAAAPAAAAAAAGLGIVSSATGFQQLVECKCIQCCCQ